MQSMVREFWRLQELILVWDQNVMIRIFTCSVAGDDSSLQSALGFGRYRRDWTSLSRDRAEVPLSRLSGTCLKMSPSLDMWTNIGPSPLQTSEDLVRSRVRALSPAQRTAP